MAAAKPKATSPEPSAYAQIDANATRGELVLLPCASATSLPAWTPIVKPTPVDVECSFSLASWCAQHKGLMVYGKLAEESRSRPPMCMRQLIWL